MASLCEGGNEPPDFLRVIWKYTYQPGPQSEDTPVCTVYYRAGDGAVRFGAVTVTSLLVRLTGSGGNPTLIGGPFFLGPADTRKEMVNESDNGQFSENEILSVLCSAFKTGETSVNINKDVDDPEEFVSATYSTFLHSSEKGKEKNLQAFHGNLTEKRKRSSKPHKVKWKKMKNRKLRMEEEAYLSYKRSKDGKVTYDTERDARNLGPESSYKMCKIRKCVIVRLNAASLDGSGSELAAARPVGFYFSPMTDSEEDLLPLRSFTCFKTLLLSLAASALFVLTQTCRTVAPESDRFPPLSYPNHLFYQCGHDVPVTLGCININSSGGSPTFIDICDVVQRAATRGNSRVGTYIEMILSDAGVGIRCGLVDKASARRAENPVQIPARERIFFLRLTGSGGNPTLIGGPFFLGPADTRKEMVNESDNGQFSENEILSVLCSAFKTGETSVNINKDVDDPEEFVSATYSTFLHSSEKGKEKNLQAFHGNLTEKRKRSSKPHKVKWKKMKNRKLRMEEEAYLSYKRSKDGKVTYDTERDARNLGPESSYKMCQNSKVRGCNLIPNERRHIFQGFWKTMTWGQRNVHISNLVNFTSTKRPGSTNSELRRKRTFAYNLKN
ncbi:hypothetical protein ANN_26699 [Periplaneta americana]|uniref:Uncharacterized protein n=1 Tax=Periplaneta americana TaxID=6978 RepID=A0ABQ8RZB9_PERAM|nr:hypothetical protein ANN_26699 [Periplaneta americana]